MTTSGQRGDLYVRLARTLAGRVRRLRVEHGDRQVDLADRLGLGQEMISNVEHGKNLLSVEGLVRLCELYAVTPNYLLGYTNKKS